MTVLAAAFVGKPVDWDKLHVDTVTSLLKLWFREMVEPIFTFEYYAEFVAAQRMSARLRFLGPGGCYCCLRVCGSSVRPLPLFVAERCVSVIIAQ